MGEHDAGGYEYGHIETITDFLVRGSEELEGVMLVGDDGREIYAQVKDLEEG